MTIKPNIAGKSSFGGKVYIMSDFVTWARLIICVLPPHFDWHPVSTFPGGHLSQLYH